MMVEYLPAMASSLAAGLFKQIRLLWLIDSNINTHSLLILAEVKCWMFQVSLPDRSCEVHQLKLSQDEQAVYDVVFAQSR